MSTSDKILLILTVNKGRLFYGCLFTDSSIADYICLSRAVLLVPQMSSSPNAVLADNFSSSLWLEERETSEILRLEYERDECSALFV